MYPPPHPKNGNKTYHVWTVADVGTMLADAWSGDTVYVCGKRYVMGNDLQLHPTEEEYVLQ
jgi:hypothetical protein